MSSIVSFTFREAVVDMEYNGKFASNSLKGIELGLG